MPPSTDGKPEARRKDVLDVIEATISGLLRLAVSIFVTIFTFLVHPRQIRFDDSRLTRPLTFLFVAFFAMTGLFTLLFTFAPSHGIPLPPTVSWAVTAFSKWDYKGLLALLSPFLIGVALFALGIVWASRASLRSLTFDRSLVLACYGAGTIAFIYVAFMPVFVFSLSLPRGSALLFFNIVFGIIGWALLFRATFGYLCLLKRELNCTRRQTMRVFFSGSLRFLAVFYAVLIYTIPIIHLIMGDITNQPFPQHP